MRWLRPLASMKLTVTLLTLAMALIFLGTLAQVRLGVWDVVTQYFRSPVAWIELQMFVPPAAARVPWQVPFPGGMLIGLGLVVNLLAAHLILFKWSWRRIGIIALHAGLILLLTGEFATAWLADEGMMSIDVGGQSRIVEDMRSTELVLIDMSDPKLDRVISISQSRVERHAHQQSRMADPLLPVEMEIVRWMPNAHLIRTTSPGLADQGVGLEAAADPQPRARGVDGAQSDAPAAYVRLHHNGKPLGTWLLSAHLIAPQTLEIDGRPFGLALRYKRTYLPYTLHLLEFRHDRFPGTQIPRNFSSRVQLVDPQTGTDRQAVIWMNNPLRYRGGTFYQSSYKPDGSGTVLQVVHNPGAMLPYLACTLVGGGMMFHFVLGLMHFLQKRSKPVTVAKDSPAPSRTPQALWQRLLPWAVGGAGLVIASAGLLRPMPSSEYDLSAFAALPVSSGGRIKPMDSAARHALMVAGGRQAVRTETGQVPASRFLLDLMARPEAIQPLPVVRVDHPDVLALLARRPDQGGRLALQDIEPHWHEVSVQANHAMEVDPKARDAFQRELLKLHHAVNTLLAHARMHEPYMIAPLGPDDEWRPFHDVFMDSAMAPTSGHPRQKDMPFTQLHPSLAYYVSMMTSYSQQDAPAFNRAVQGYTELLQRDMPQIVRQMRIEVLFNRAALFINTITVYVLAMLLLCGWLLLRLRRDPVAADDIRRPWWEYLRVSAVALLWAAVIVHTLAIVLRIYLQGRPPVTNLYSSAVFVGWAAVLLGLLLERWHPIGLAALGASVVGVATLIIAHNLGSEGDTMQMMQAVLDSNFWLATHVITIALGYSTTFLAGALGAIYLLMGVFSRELTPSRADALTRMVYGTVCFSLLLSFVGTVLGGIWADQSWGRFWGWDPKENGAALVVLINAIILHARWGGLIRQRGIMTLAVAGNIVTAWSWFGTNMLGIGLHAYGFMESAVFWLLLFIVSQLVIIGLGLTPQESWRSGHSGAARRQPQAR